MAVDDELCTRHLLSERTQAQQQKGQEQIAKVNTAGEMTSLSNRVQVNLSVVERFEPLRKPAHFVVYMQNDEKISGRGTGISSEGWRHFPACAALLLPLSVWQVKTFHEAKNP